MKQAMEITPTLLSGGAVCVVFALAPRAEIDGEMGDAHVGLQAQLKQEAGQP